VKLKKFLSSRTIKKAQTLPRPDKTDMVSTIVADLDDKNNKPHFSDDQLPQSGKNILRKKNPTQEVYDMKVAQSNASQGSLPKRPLQSFVSSRRPK